MSYCLHPIGRIHTDNEGFRIELEKEYIPAATGLEGFSHIQVIWWFDRCDDAHSRSTLMENKPYTSGPAVIGTFATRSPQRPNPIAVTPARVIYLDHEKGIIGLAWIDAADGTPVLDIKPYTPGIDRVEAPLVPDWCRHWPKSTEESGTFDWAREFNF